MADELAFPNGMVITPDNKTLVIAESFARVLTAYDISADSSLSNRRVWAPHTGDGMVMDADGAIWTPGWADNGPRASGSPKAARSSKPSRWNTPASPAPSAAPDGRTLYILTADWHMQESFESNLDRLLTGPTPAVFDPPGPRPAAGRRGATRRSQLPLQSVTAQLRPACGQAIRRRFGASSRQCREAPRAEPSGAPCRGAPGPTPPVASHG